jgi:dihydroflavonol-4-reductase
MGSTQETVLVTGGTGFIAAHCLVQLLEAGYRVRATMRDLKREPEVRSMLQTGGADPGDRLTCFRADLSRDDGWAEAAAGCDYVLHVASPLPLLEPKNEDEVIGPAREGAVRALRAAHDAGVQRVVLTSSFAAVGYGHPPQSEPFDETSWTDPKAPGLSAYVKSKTLAERAAWDFVEREGGGMELSVVNPVAVFGPALGPDLSASVEVVRRMLDGGIPGCPRIAFGVVDVRDVADLHLRAMTHPAAAGERFLATGGPSFQMVEIARALKRGLGPAARRVSTWQVPDWVVRAAAVVWPAPRAALSQLGHTRSATSEKAHRMLGWQARSDEESVIATGESLVRLGICRP